VVTLLDHLPSLRRAAAQRIAADRWPHDTVVDDLGRLCVGGMALTEVAAEFDTPVTVLDEDELRQRLHRCHAGAGDVVPVLAGEGLPITVMRWVDDEGLGLAIRRGADLAAALAGRVRTDRMVLHARGLSHDELLAGAAAAPGRIVVESTTDVSYLCGATHAGQRVLVGALDGTPDPAVVARVLHDPRLDLVGFHCHAGADVAQGVRAMLSSMWEFHRTHGRLLTEIQLTVDSEADPAALAGSVGEAVEAACSATRLPRPRVVIESRWPVLRLAGVTVLGVTSVLSCPAGPRAVVVTGAAEPNGAVALANRHPLSANERMRILASDGTIVHDVDLPCDVHAGDVLAVAPACTAEDAPLITVRGGTVRTLRRRMTLGDKLSRDTGYSAGSGDHQHLGGLNPDGHLLPRRELPGL
jgi:diaminopimelate decarboxylase